VNGKIKFRLLEISVDLQTALAEERRLEKQLDVGTLRGGTRRSLFAEQTSNVSCHYKYLLDNHQSNEA
jgi:hypothetical protein